MTRPGTLRITRDIVRIFEIIASPGRGNGTLYVVAKTKQTYRLVKGLAAQLEELAVGDGTVCMK